MRKYGRFLVIQIRSNPCMNVTIEIFKTLCAILVLQNSINGNKPNNDTYEKLYCLSVTNLPFRIASPAGHYHELLYNAIM